MTAHIMILHDLATQHETQMVCEIVGQCSHQISIVYNRINICLGMINVQLCDKNKYAALKKSAYLIITSRLHDECAHLTKKYKGHLIKHITSSKSHTLDNLEKVQQCQIPLLNIDKEQDKHILIQGLLKHILLYNKPPFQSVLSKIFSCFQVQTQNPTGFNDISSEAEELTEHLLPATFYENNV